MTTAPWLGVERPDGDVHAVALLLHGGRETSQGPVRAHNLAAARMVPFARSLVRAGRGRGLAVARLRYQVRGWNGAQRSPVADAQWALSRLADELGPVPVAVIGHSMGGRTALYVAGAPSVRAVVGLAPWIEQDDPVGPVTGRQVLFVHGSRDKVTSPRATAAFAAAATGRAESVGLIALHGERHAMLRRPRLWHELTTGFVLSALCDVPPGGTVHGELANVLTKALAGDTSLVM